MKKCNENGQRQIRRMLGPKNELDCLFCTLTNPRSPQILQRKTLQIYRQIDRQIDCYTNRSKEVFSNK